jgi:hypothetical protein
MTATPPGSATSVSDRDGPSEHLQHSRARRRRALYVVGAVLGLLAGFVLLFDLALYRQQPLPAEYCRVSAASAEDRPGLAPGDLTTHEADSGCLRGEQHLCGYERIVLPDVIEARPQPC